MSASDNGHPDNVPQLERFKQAVRDLEADQDETRWQDRLKKVAKHKPVEEKPE